MKRFLFATIALLLAVPSFATCYFREDTASQTFQLGPFLDSTDGITVEAGLTISNTDIRLSKDGGNFAAKNSGGGTYDEVGMYTVTFDATDTNTAGNLQIVVNETGAVPVFHECLVIASDYYDLLDGTNTVMTSRQTGNMLETTVATAPTTTTVTLTAAASNDDAYNYGTVEFVGGTEECIKTITDYTASSKTLEYDSVCNFTVATADTVRVHVGSSGKAVEDLEGSVAALNDISAVAVNAEVDTALSDVGLDHLVLIQGTADSGTTTTLVDAILTQADYYWNNSTSLVVQFATGPEVRCIRSFTASTDTIGVVPAFSQAVGTEDYVILPAPTCRNFP